MPQHAPPHAPTPRLAEAFLALGDEGGAAVDRPPGLRTIVAALAATFVLALSAPLAWAAAAPASKPSDQPTATTASKAGVPAPDDDGGDGGV
jgi:hypothetical protein